MHAVKRWYVPNVLHVMSLLVLVPSEASAHGLASAAVREWEFAPLVIVPLAVTAILYAIGLARVWRRAGIAVESRAGRRYPSRPDG